MNIRIIPSLILSLVYLVSAGSLAHPQTPPPKPPPTTLPKIDTSGPFTLFAIGDAGKAGEVLDNNAASMEKEAERLVTEGARVNAMVFLGDNFYPVGLNHDLAERKALVEEILGPVAGFLRQLGRTNVHAVPGNHDYYCDLFGPAPYGTCHAGNLYEASIPIWTYHLDGPASIRYPVEKGSSDSIELIMMNSAIFMLTDREYWHFQTDSLRRLLNNSINNRSVKWRLLFDHHPPYTFGEHGGYRVWDPQVQRVRRLGNCIADRKDPIKYIQRFAGSFEDNCAPHYQSFNDTLFHILDETKAQIHVMMSGHDHNLQLLAQRGGLPGSPKVFIVTGAGAKTSAVRTPFVDTRRGFQYYAHPINTPEKQGESIYGFTVCQVVNNQLKIWFIDGATGEKASMGGASTFYVDRKGYLVKTE